MKEYLGKLVKVVIDRPIGTKITSRNLVYPINCGHIPGTISKDGKEIDAYVIGELEPLERYVGLVVAIIKRENDNECRLVVCKDMNKYSKHQIKAMVEFKEKAFKSTIIMFNE